MTLLLVYSHTDKELLLKIASGDKDSFETLYHCYCDVLIEFAKKYVKSTDFADDIVQDVFVRLWEKREDLASVELIRPYLFTSVRNQTLNFLKKASREKDLKEKIIQSYKPEYDSGDNALLHAEYIQFIERILQLLPNQTRKVFRLCRENEQSYDETALQLNISRNAVKKHMVRAHKLFREKLLNNTGFQILLLIFLS